MHAPKHFEETDLAHGDGQSEQMAALVKRRLPSER